MGLFDAVREKAAELLSGAGDKVSELTGTELPTDEVANTVSDATQDVSEAAQDLPGTAGEVADSAVTDATEQRDQE